jgi:hypothetical protein
VVLVVGASFDQIARRLDQLVIDPDTGTILLQAGGSRPLFDPLEPRAQDVSSYAL